MDLKLKEIRTLKGYSQQEVADWLHCSAISYSRYETGNRSPSYDILVKIADFFDVTVDYLLGREHISENCLTPYEVSLVEASRKADDRAKNDALKLLVSHSINTDE